MRQTDSQNDRNRPSMHYIGGLKRRIIIWTMCYCLDMSLPAFGFFRLVVQLVIINYRHHCRHHYSCHHNPHPPLAAVSSSNRRYLASTCSSTSMHDLSHFKTFFKLIALFSCNQIIVGPHGSYRMLHIKLSSLFVLNPAAFSILQSYFM